MTASHHNETGGSRPLADIPKSAQTASMSFPNETLDAAHRHSANHKAELERSEVCGCFFCEKAFAVKDIAEWVDDESGTALCPRCGVDAVIGSASGFPVADAKFIGAMRERWFN
ncbi:hypothetical protein [Novosphingobium sediminicola]|nr:hypothetical protein [Novosphingobium sediminicola]